MRVSPVFSTLGVPTLAALQSPGVVSAAAGSLNQTLQRFLVQTLGRRLDWRHRRRREQGDIVEDTFVAEDAEARVELSASRREPSSGRASEPEAPRQLLRWQVTITFPAQKPRTLDGRDLALPTAVPQATTNPAEHTLAKLFRAAFETLVRGFDALVAPLQALAGLLRANAIQSCYSFIRPSLANPLGAAEVLQVNGTHDGQPVGLELTRFLGQRHITLRWAQRVVKLGDSALENACVRSVIGDIEALCAAQRQGRPVRGPV